MKLTRHTKLRRRRAVEFIEFAILLPFFVFFITFAIDMGRLTMLQASVQDATQQVARAGAQNGGWDFVDPTLCPGAVGQCTGTPLTLLTGDVKQTPYGNLLIFKSLTSYVSNDGSTYGGAFCVNNAYPYVVVHSQYDASHIFLTPGLYQFLGIALGNFKDNWTLNATAVARVDVCH
jgi:hypothetical protein